MKPRLLLDSHVPVEVARPVRSLYPAADVQHVSKWQNGAYRNAEDDLLLEACWLEKRALVSKDRATLPGWIALRIAAGKDHAGVLFYDGERFKAPQIGPLARAIVAALKVTRGNLINRWITLR